MIGGRARGYLVGSSGPISAPEPIVCLVYPSFGDFQRAGHAHGDPGWFVSVCLVTHDGHRDEQSIPSCSKALCGNPAAFLCDRTGISGF